MTDDGPIAPGTLPISTHAPGKCIVFGEHAVVHGRPELLLAVDLYTQVVVQSAAASVLNGDPRASRDHPYFAAALERLGSGMPPLDVRTVSRVPRAAGLGSSAAFCAALAAALLSATGGASRAHLAEVAFAIERAAQGVGSPGDTSASVGGGLLSVNVGADDPLWSLTDGEHVWEVRRVRDPSWVWLVAFSGVPRSTGDAVRAVGERLRRPDGAILLDRFTQVATEGIRAVEREDRTEVGRCMIANQELLVEVGVSHPRLEALLTAVAPFSHGAKITGAGAGGSVVALPRPGEEMKAARAVTRAGGVPFVVRASPSGASLDP
ncbi:MAG: mevalonate kinase [Thermoplasmata archaeon]